MNSMSSFSAHVGFFLELAHFSIECNIILISLVAARENKNTPNPKLNTAAINTEAYVAIKHCTATAIE